jgi:hypothetical protein
MNTSMRHPLALAALAVSLTGCVNPQAPGHCITGTLLLKGNAPHAKPHLHAGRELYQLDFVRDDPRTEDKALLELQGKTVRVCGDLTPETTPLPSRLRVDQMTVPSRP